MEIQAATQTREQLMSELEEMRQRLVELEASEARHKQAEEELREHQDSLVTEHTAELEKVNAMLQSEIVQHIQTEKSGQKSKSEHRYLFENMPSGIAYHEIIVDEDNKPIDYIFLNINEAFEKLTGLKREVVLGKKVTEIIPGIGESEYDWIGAYGRVALTGETAMFEQYSRSLEKWYSIHAYSPERKYFVAVFSDITDYKHAEEELEKHRLHLEELVEERTEELAWANKDLHEAKAHLYEITYNLDERVKELDCLYKISNLVEIPGISLEEIIRSTVDIIPPSWQYPESTCARIIVEEEEYKTGNFRQTDQRLTSNITVQGKLSGYVEVCYLEEDQESGQEIFLKEERTLLDAIAARFGHIIERKRMTDELHKSEKRYRQLVESINEGFWIVDKDVRTTFVNNRMAQMLGYTVDEMMGEYLFSFMDTQGAAEVEANLQNLGQGINEQREFDWFRKKDGTRLYVMVETSAITDDDGNYVGAMAAVMDITKRKIMEEQLKQAQKLEAVGQLAAGMAHEINSPIQYIGDNTRFLQESFSKMSCLCAEHHKILETAKEGDVIEELIAKMGKAMDEADIEYLWQEVPLTIEQSLEGIARVAEIVRTVREFSHPGTSEKVLIDINRSIKTTVTVSRNEWKYVAEVAMDLDDHLPMTLGLPGEFNQAILNIITNAAHTIADFIADTSEDKGLITISTRKDGDWIEIRISDTGTGIPEEIRTRVFEPFFTTKEVGKGTGQGLAIVHNVVVEKHGGTITFESETGEGTTFIIRLPIHYVSEEKQ